MTTINLKDFYYWYTQDQFIEVTEEVAGALRASIRYEAAYSELAARINSAPLKKSKSKRLEDAIAAKEKELAKIMRYKQALYQNWKDGEITRNDYRYMSEDYERQAEALNTLKTPEITILRQEPQQYATFSIASYILHAKIFTIFC